MGGRWLFSLENVIADKGISATANIGRSNLRADIGGLLITSGNCHFPVLISRRGLGFNHHWPHGSSDLGPRGEFGS